MRILHVISSVDPGCGGPTEVVRMLVELASSDVHSEVVTVDAPSASFLAAFPCKVHALGPPRTALKYSLRLLPWLRANRSRFDGVVVHGLWNYITFASWRSLRGHTPYIVFTHGMLDPYFKRRFPLKHARNWLYWLVSDFHVLRNAHRVLFTTDAERMLAEQSFFLWSWKPLVVPLGTVEPPEPGAADRAAFHALCPQVEGRRFLLFLGRIHPKKGCDLLLEAFGQTSRLAPDVHLVLAGPDPTRWQPQLAALAASSGLSSRVHWPGMLSGGVKQAALQAAEAFVLSSHQENFGIAVVEALAVGRPVLLSDKVNIAAEIASDGAGLVEPDTLEGTVNLLSRWFALGPEEREVMSRQAFQTFSARYNMRRNAEAILGAFSLKS